MLYFGWVGRHPLFAIIFAALMSLVWGVFGQDFGIRDLFWHENAATQFLAGMSVAGLAILLLLFGLALEDDQAKLAASFCNVFCLNDTVGEVRSGNIEMVDATKEARKIDAAPVPSVREPNGGKVVPELYILAMFAPFGVALCYPQVAIYSIPSWAPKFAENKDCWALPLGAWIAFGIAELVLWFFWRIILPIWKTDGRRCRHANIAAMIYICFYILAPVVFFIGSTNSRDPLVAAYAIAVVLGTVATLSFLLTTLAHCVDHWFFKAGDRVDYRRRFSLATILHTAVLIIVFLLGRGQWRSEQYRLTLPGLEPLYDEAGIVHLEFPAKTLASFDQTALWLTAAPPIAERKPEQVIGALTLYLKKHPGDLSALQQRGILFWANNNPDMALKDFDEILRVDSKNHHALSARAGIYLEMKNKDSAFEDLNKLVLCHPKSSDAFLSRGDAYAMLGTTDDDDKALKDYGRAIKLDRTSARAYFKRALVNARKELIDEAMQDAEKASSFDPENPEIWTTLGRHLLENSDNEKAISALSDAIALGARAEAFYLRGLALSNLEKFKKAETDMEQAIQTDVRTAKYYVGLGSILNDAREPEKAIKAFDQAIKINMCEYQAFIGRAHVLVGMKKYDKAQIWYDKAIAIDRNEPEAHEGKINAWISDGHAEKAIELFERTPKLLQASPIRMNVKLGDALQAAGQHEKAISAYDEAEKHLPPRSYFLRDIYWKRGNSWLALGKKGDGSNISRIDNAIRDYTASINLGRPTRVRFFLPWLFPYYLKRAEAYLARGKYVEAIIDATVAAVVRPKSQEEPLEIRAQSREKLNDLDGAQEDRQGREFPRRVASHISPSLFLSTQETIDSVRAQFVTKPKLDHGLLDDLETLNHWRNAQGVEKPKLAVVAASGGGIVAAYWTARCLCALEDQYNPFPRHIRVITGASGGMVGAGYYCATLTPDSNNRTFDNRTLDDLTAIFTAVRADSLTPVMRQLVLGDLPGLVMQGRPRYDRGRALEDAWVTNSGGPESSRYNWRFRCLAAGELEGWRPSLIVSPMIVEEGRPMLISNLRLKGLGGGVELFELMPEAMRLTLATALRTNAAFPLITPAVSLPTCPPRHLVDAGYLDNYGVTLATDWIHRHRRWLRDNTGGVALIRIQAYPNPHNSSTSNPGNETSGKTPCISEVPASGSFLIPLSAYSQAKLSITLDQHMARIGQLSNWFNGSTKFFRDFHFVGNVEAPLSWTLTSRDRTQLDKAIVDNKAEFDQLKEFLRSEAGAAPAEAPTPPTVE